MTAPVFLLRPLPAAGALVLDGPEGRHAATVRRLRAGERVDVTDGLGALAECTVAAVGRDRLELDVLRRLETSAPQPRLSVAQALVKGERSELAAELATEIGVDEIVPWAARRCVSRWVPGRSDRKWEQAVAEAAKQARRARWPVVSPLTTTAELTDRIARLTGAGGVAYVLHEQATQALVETPPPPGTPEVLLVVGPEGGVDDDEVDAFAGAGARTVVLGPTVLRASTAGAAAAAVLSAVTGRWSSRGMDQ